MRIDFHDGRANWLRWQTGGLTLLLCTVMAAVCGCLTESVRLAGGSPFPESPRYHIPPRTYTKDELARYGLRTDGVYVDMGEVPPEKHDPAVVTGYTFYRFWPNGRVMFRVPGIGPLRSSDVAAIDSLRHGNVGYYEFTGDGGIKIELFLPVGMTYAYGWTKFTIDGDSLWIHSSGYRNFHPLGHVTTRLGYRFMHINGMTEQSDW